MNIRTAKKVAGSIKKVVEENIGQPGSDDEVYIGADERPTYRVDDLAEKAALSALAGESVAVLSEEGGLIFLAIRRIKERHQRHTLLLLFCSASSLVKECKTIGCGDWGCFEPCFKRPF
jgi:fructose-1,6-bisphosphatase/inositol monophosphatase family enzyme